MLFRSQVSYLVLPTPTPTQTPNPNPTPTPTLTPSPPTRTRYKSYRAQYRKEDLSDVEAMRVIYVACSDLNERQVVVIAAKALMQEVR